MPINTSCPGCKSQFQLQDQLAGQQIQCQNCQTVFTAPAASSVPPVQPQAPVKQQQSVGSVFDQFSNEQPAQETYGSVYDQVAAQNPPPKPGQPLYPNYPHDQKSGSSKGLVIGGVIGCAVFALIGLAIAGWFIFRMGNKPTEVAEKKVLPAHPVNSVDRWDQAVERMTQKYGERKLATISLNISNTNSAEVSKKLRQVDNKLELFCTQKGNQYEILIAPIDNVREFSKKLTWTTVTSVSRAEQRIVAKGKTSPSSVASNSKSGPSRSPVDARSKAQDMIDEAEARIAEARKRNEEEAAERQKERAKNQADRTADRNFQPRDGETISQWVSRFLKSPFAKQNVEALTKMEVVESEREAVATELAGVLPALRSPFEKQAVANALAVWRTDESDAKLIAFVNDTEPIHAKWIIPALGKIKTAKSADALTRFIPEFFGSDEACEALIAIGPVAEEAVLRGKMDQNEKIRSKVYAILAEIGTRTSYEALRENRKLETDLNLNQQVRATMKAIAERHPK